MFTEIWREAKSGGSIVLGGERMEAEAVLAQLQLHLASTCGKLHLRRGTNLWNMYSTFLSALYNDSKTFSIISFNYDLLIEQCLDDMRMPYGYGRTKDLVFDSFDRNRKRYQDEIDIDILKLHGSSNWGICRGCRNSSQGEGLITAFDGPLILTRRKSCPDCGERWLSPGIVPPIIGKAAEIQPMIDMWKQARKLLRRPREILIIGYSLPATDLEAQSLLREIVSDEKRARITLVCGQQGFSSAYQSIFPSYKDKRCYFEEFLDEYL